MLPALLMFARVARALRYAVREEDFLTALGAGVTLLFVGTLSYSLGEGWNVVDAFYFAVSTLTTTSVADPDLVLDEGWMKLFTVFYLLIGIGILVEILRPSGSRSSRSRPTSGRRRPHERAVTPRPSSS